MIAPTVARNLHFRPKKGDQLSIGLPDGEPLAAFLAAVIGPDRVNLCVLSWKGHPQAVRNVKLVQAGETPPADESYAEWMPYQQGQAAKTEQLEKALASGSTGVTAQDGTQQGLADPGASHGLAPSIVPASSLDTTEAMSAAVAVAPRVALDDIKAAIASRYDFTAGAAIAALQMPVGKELDILSICVLTMRNGFTVIGKSAPASPENFNADLGRQYAYEDAVRQLWPLMGFSLRDQLAANRDKVDATA